MRDLVLKLFSENTFKGEITLFSFWHFFYLALIFGTSLILSILFKNKEENIRNKIVKFFAYLTIGLYIADFFIMPLSDSYDGISAYKLPFNICTIMAVLVPFVEFNKKFEKIKPVIVILSITSSLMWMCYPGSALGGQPPFSYIIFQTFMYHGFLFTWAVLSISLGKTKLNIKNCWKVLIGILLILVWATLGNTIYAEYDWFFITGETFPFLPKNLMPLIVVSAVFGVSIIVYGLYYLIIYIDKKLSNLTNKKDKIKND